MLKKIRKMLQKQEGFTLVELMIVVVILGIISGIGIQQYGKVQEQARRTAHNANVRIIESAAQMYIMGGGDETEDINNLVPDYLQDVPKNPWGGKSYTLSIKGSLREGFSISVEPGYVDENGQP